MTWSKDSWIYSYSWIYSVVNHKSDKLPGIVTTDLLVSPSSTYNRLNKVIKVQKQSMTSECISSCCLMVYYR